MKLALFLLALQALNAGDRILTLRQAVDLASRQNPDLVLARIDEEKAQLGVNVVKEPLMPRIQVGSGLAYTYGFPLSIEGSAPSIIEATAVRSLYNPVRSRQLAQARETARGAAIQTAATREDAALQVAILFLDLEKSARARDLAAQQLEHLRKVEAAVRLRVSEGRELAIEGRRAALNSARGAARIQSAQSAFASAQRALALALGLAPGEAIAPALEDRTLPALPASEDTAVASALQESKELRKLESDRAARELEAQGFRASRLPTIDFVAKYGLFGRFNNYEDYFLRFQRNNGLVGASFRLPLFADSAETARAAQSTLEANRLRTQAATARGRIESDARGHWSRVREADQVRELAKMDLDLARETVGVILAQFEEGRASLRQIEEARYLENERWLALWEAQYSAERTRMELLRHTESLLAALR